MTLTNKDTVSSLSHRTIAALESRRIGLARSSARQERLELDSHADTCVAGSNCLKISSSGRSVSVAGFISELDTLSAIEIATAATAYTCTNTGRTIILIINE